MRTRKTILEMEYSEARNYLLESTSYFNNDLPQYINLSICLEKANLLLNQPKISIEDLMLDNTYDSVYDGINYKIWINKKAKYSWRMIQLIHPVVYVDLVNLVTSEENWKLIKELFRVFQEDDKVKCVSIPVRSTGRKSDKAEIISNWWEHFEQLQIAYGIKYSYCLHTDITDCYGSINTHAIPLALKQLDGEKDNRKSEIGNELDKKIRFSQCGDTSGIPQGSTLMDLIAEIILGYSDKNLSDILKKKKMSNFQILRYRDDYRIFSNSKDDINKIVKYLSEVLAELNLKLSPTKTKLSENIILDAIKPDKLYWSNQSLNFAHKKNKSNCQNADEKNEQVSSLSVVEEAEFEFDISVQKHLQKIKVLGDKYPDCGSLLTALNQLYSNRIYFLKDKKPNDIYQIISIIINILVSNPKTIKSCIIILGKLFSLMEFREIDCIIEHILNRFSNSPNTEMFQIWLQRLSVIRNRDIEYETKMCRKVMNPEDVKLWNSDWLKGGFDEAGLINETEIDNLTLESSINEIDIFYEYQ